jgi:hypothetical protein
MQTRWLTYAAVFYAVGFLVHNADHLRRGFSVETTQVLVLGSAAGLMQLVAIGAVLARHRLAPVMAVVLGFADAVGISAVHLLPHWSSFSDAFPGAHGSGVTSLSWAAALIEVAGALAFGIAGAQVLRSQAVTPALAEGVATGC